MELNTIPTELFWFLGGAIFHKIGSNLLGYGKVANFAHDTINQTLKLLILIMEDVAFMREMKYLHMQQTGASEESIENIKQIDENMFNAWKTIVIHKFISVYPNNLKGLVKFRTWNEAVNILTKEMKKTSPRK